MNFIQIIKSIIYYIYQVMRYALLNKLPIFTDVDFN